MSPALPSIARGVLNVDLLRALAATNRQALENMIAISIDILDEIDGDADGQDGNGAEDEPVARFNDPDWLRRKKMADLPGCPVADPSGDGDWSWPASDAAECSPLFTGRP